MSEVAPQLQVGTVVSVTSIRLGLTGTGHSYEIECIEHTDSFFVRLPENNTPFLEMKSTIAQQ